MTNPLKSFFWLLKQVRWYKLYKLDVFRFLVCKARKLYFIKLKKNLKTWQGSESHMLTFDDGQKTIEYNLQGLIDVSCARSLRLIKPLSTIETIRPLEEAEVKGGALADLDYECNAKVLSIGPRTEGELFCLRGYGFKASNIRGLDLISYSPYIDVGDMHAMPYNNDSFDVILSSCVLGYSLEPQKACDEMLRVAKEGALICFSHDVHHKTHQKYPIKTCQHYLDFFKGHVKRVFFTHELPEHLSDTHGNYTCSVIFQISKQAVA